jgi:outer membrane protein OmpA-like peptidoglycan-associated protein
MQLNRNYVFTVSEPGYLFFSRFMNQGKANSVDEAYPLDIVLQPIEIGAEVQLYNIYFDTDSFRILPQSGSELQNLVTFLKNNSELKIEIQGHTDSSGNAENNKLLSERRAKSVVDYLTENGIKITRLKFGGYGDKVPISSNETAEGRMLNRRTTIKILEK